MSYIGNSPGAGPTNKIEQGNSSVEVIDTGTGRIEFTTDGTKVAEIDASGNMKFDSGYGSAETAYGCRAWVNFNGTGTVAIRESGNVSSITDNGTGNYTVNFTNALTDADYAAVFGTRGVASTPPIIACERHDTPLRSTTQLAVYTLYNSSGWPTIDCPTVSVAIIR